MKKLNGIPIGQTDGRYLNLDQTAPQTTVGTFTFPQVSTPIILPSADSTTALQITKADGATNVLNVDTTNARLGIGTVTPSKALHVVGNDVVVWFEGYAGTLSSSPGIFVKRGRGTVASPAGVVSGTALGGFYAAGMTSSLGFSGNSCTFLAYAAETFTTAAQGADAHLELAPIGGATRAKVMSWLNNGNVGIGTTSPTAFLHLKAGVATANAGAPLKFTAGTDLATAEIGAIEYDGTNFHITHSDAVRNIIVPTIGLTSGRIPFAITTNSELGDDASLTYAIATGLSTTKPITSTLAGGTAPFAVTSTTVNTNLNADMLDGLHTTDLAIVKQNIQVTARTTAIGSTNITGTNTAGLYRVSYYLEDTTADITAGTIMATIGWTDDAGATTTSSVALPLTAVGRTSDILYVRVLGTGSIQYSTTLVGVIGTSQYAIFISAERLL